MYAPSAFSGRKVHFWVFGSFVAALLCSAAGVLTAVLVRRLAEQFGAGSLAEVPPDTVYDAPSVPHDRGVMLLGANDTWKRLTERPDLLEPYGSKELSDRLDSYLRNSINGDQEPCEDFYEYVCSSHHRRGARPGSRSSKAPSLPYGLLSTARLSYDLPRTLLRYFLLREKTYRDFPGVFVSQALFFLPNCTSTYSRNGLGWDPWMELLVRHGLLGWPYSGDPSDFNLSRVAGAVDALLGIFPFVQVKVKSEYEACCAVQLEGPQTILKRHQLWYAAEDILNYTQVVSRALSILRMMPDLQASAENLVILEMRLEDALTLRRHSSAGARERTPESLPKSKHWKWNIYLERIFYEGPPHRLGSKEEGEHSSSLWTVEVLCEDYLRDLSGILDNTSLATLANYVGYRTLVQLSPLLPDEVSFLVSLSHEGGPIPGLASRLQACAHALERLFPFGVRTFLRMTLGDDNPLRYSTELDVQVERLFNETRWLLARRVEGSRWLNPVERVIAREKLANMELVFMGSVMDLNVPAAYYGPKAPPFSGSRLLQSYLAIQANTRRVYYHPRTAEREWDFDNRYHISSLLPGAEYVHGRNTLFLPYGAVSFMRDFQEKGRKQTEKELNAVLEPVISTMLLATAFAAVDDRGTGVDHRRRWRDWWSRTAFERFFAIKDCFYRQYKRAMERLLVQDVDLVRDLDVLVAENAVLDPVYRHYLRRLSVGTRPLRLAGRRATCPTAGCVRRDAPQSARQHCPSELRPVRSGVRLPAGRRDEPGKTLLRLVAHSVRNGVDRNVWTVAERAMSDGYDT